MRLSNNQKVFLLSAAALLVTGLCTAVVILAASIPVWIFCLLWNYIAAGVFGLPALTFWQTVGLIVLVNMVAVIVKRSQK